MLEELPVSLTLDQILAADDTAVEKVPCPEWGGDVFIRSLTAAGRDALDEAKANGQSIRATIVGMSLCDESGKPLNPTEAQVAGLANKSAKPMERIADAAIALNGMGADAEQATAKNSEPADAPD